MSSAVCVREVESVSAEDIEALTQGYAFDDYRRHHLITPEKAQAYLLERIAQACAAPSGLRLLACDRAGSDPVGLLLAQPLPADSELLGMRMAGIPFVLVRADHPAPRAVLRGLLELFGTVAQRAGFAHVSVRLDTADRAGYQEFTEAGFRLVETLVSLAYDARRRGTGEIDPVQYGFEGHVRALEERDVEAIADLSARCFTHNRYHQDEHIPKRDAGALMARWARSYCADKIDCQVWVAETRAGKLAGFLGHQLNRALERHSGVLVSGRALLAAADPRSGVGQMLAQHHVWRSLGDYKEADTQLNNYGMIKVSFNLNMDMVRTKYTFHRHCGT